MFDNVNSNTISAESQNAPNLSFTATPIFGNMEFNIQAPLTHGKVQPGYPQVPYVSLESLLFFQMMSNPYTAPYTTMSGSNTGQQVIAGQYTQQDAAGISRLSQGTQQSTSGTTGA
jgi:hypothetical protein